MGLERLFGRKLQVLSGAARRNAIKALEEDGDIDITAAALGITGNCKAEVIAEESGVLCGLLEAKGIFKGLEVKTYCKEGGIFRRNDPLLSVRGNVSEILRRERTALNYLQILSGIATETRKLADRVGVRKVAALRKNHPLLTHSEKRAVQVGGGLSHRLNLSDGYLVKSTHLELLREREKISGAEAVGRAVTLAAMHRAHSGRNFFIEVEVMEPEEALAAAETGADAILIDNQAPGKVRGMVKGIRKINKKIIIEASGGITPANAKKYLDAGAQFVSMSYLALRSKPIGMHLLLKMA